MHPLMKLMASNRQRGEFQAVAGQDDSDTLYLYDMIVGSDDEAAWWGGVSPQSFVKTLNGMKASTIHLRVNSPGGSVFAGRAMEQAIREHPSQIIVHVDGLAASAASFLIMAADEIHMAPGSFVMIHNAWVMAMGNAGELRSSANLLDQIDASQVKTFAKRTGQPDAEITEWLNAETWFSAEKAVELGFADKIADDKAPEAKARQWDLSAFRNSPVGQAPTPPDKPAAPETPATAEAPATPPQPAKYDRDALYRAALKAMIPV
ncbi:head maturation protease, ClpP-related [Chitinimonas sp. PSY-7]|uniref:head maturation protease, ClpP-related n=1 Tax=Chitinimonas sp. PSY-7 TaxID=3459088 RepID=UPI00404027BB